MIKDKITGLWRSLTKEEQEVVEWRGNRSAFRMARRGQRLPNTVGRTPKKVRGTGPFGRKRKHPHRAKRRRHVG